MVATTSLGLEYQVGTDRPCDAPGVWCDFVDTLESLLIPLNDSVARLRPAVPAAKAKLITPFTIPLNTSFGLPLPFDSVEFDTDNMIDLTSSRYEIKPNRLGTYVCLGTMKGIANPGNNSHVQLFINTCDFNLDPFVSGASFCGFYDSSSPIDAGATYYWRSTHRLNWDGTFTFGPSLFVSTPTAIALTISEATLTVYWVGD